MQKKIIVVTKSTPQNLNSREVVLCATSKEIALRHLKELYPGFNGNEQIGYSSSKYYFFFETSDLLDN